MWQRTNLSKKIVRFFHNFSITKSKKVPDILNTIRAGELYIILCKYCSVDIVKGKGKAKAYNTCLAPQVAYRNCWGAGHDTERAGVGLIGRRLSLRPQSDLWPTSHTQPVCRLMVSTRVIHVITWITTHLPTLRGWKAELAWLVDQ